MKPSQIAVLTSALSVVIAINWEYRARPALAATVAVTITAACGYAPPTCVAAALAGLFTIILGSFSANNNNRGSAYNSPLPISNGKRGIVSRQIFHDHGNGTVTNHLDTSVLKHGVLHNLWDSTGLQYTATRHSKTNDPILRVFLGGPTTVSRRGANGKRADDEIDSFSGSWNEAGTVSDEFTDQDAQNEGNIARANLFEDPDTCTTLKAGYLCSTLNAGADDETFNISIDPQGPGFPTESEPACGA